MPSDPRRRRWLVGSGVVLALAVVVAAIWFAAPRATDHRGQAREGAPGTLTGPVRQGGTVRFAADREPVGFNVNTTKDAGTSIEYLRINLYPQPFHVHPDYSVHLDTALLDSAEQASQNPQTIVYRIRQDANWSDGVPVSADDFIYLWKNSNGSNPKIDVASVTGYDQIGSVTGSDGGKTVTVVFSRPFADWRSLFGGILPSHYLRRQKGGWNTGLDKHPERIPSAGPFVVGGYRPGDNLTLLRNDRYFGPKAHLDRIVFRFLPESTTQPAALQDDEVDLIYPQPQLDEVKQVEALPNVQSQVNFGPSFEHLDFNLRNRFLADPRVRRAIATALDRQQLLQRTVKQFSDKATVLGNRMWPPGRDAYQDHFGAYGKGDVAGAERLLRQAGYRKGPDGIYAKGGRRLSLRFSTSAGNWMRETEGTVFQQQMKRLGIRVVIANTDPVTLFSDRLPNGNFDVAGFAWVGTRFVISTNRSLYQCDSTSNYGRYCSRKVDALFTRALGSLDQRKAAALVNLADRQLTDDMATIPLYQLPTFIAFRSGLVNLGDNVGPDGPFWNAGSWGYAA
jgi:peptide/nickel transport system substrate-binding protein